MRKLCNIRLLAALPWHVLGLRVALIADCPRSQPPFGLCVGPGHRFRILIFTNAGPVRVAAAVGKSSIHLSLILRAPKHHIFGKELNREAFVNSLKASKQVLYKFA